MHAPATALPTTIEGVIDRLDEIVDWSRTTGSRLGYFAALYRQVTQDVLTGVQAGFFEDAERMARLDVIFANRYLEAYDRYRRGERLTRAWGAAFAQAGRWSPIVLQHLFLGMNAHIVLDLGIAAAESASGESIHELQRDFGRINDLLIARINSVQEELAQVWPLLRLLDALAGTGDERLAALGLRVTRGHAWRTAVALASLTDDARKMEIDQLDGRTAGLTRLILRPRRSIRTALTLIRLGEVRSVARVIDILT